jgi:hypothetical protein
MATIIREISEHQFKKLDAPILFENELSDRVFGEVSKRENKYRFGWQSTGIMPVWLWITDSVCSIGIDLIFVIFDFDSGQILMKLPLDYFFYDVKLQCEFLFVLTELEVIRISTSNWVVSKSFALPDYFETIEFREGCISARCINGEVIEIG